MSDSESENRSDSNSDTASEQGSETLEELEATESQPAYDISRVIHYSRVLTSDDVFFTPDQESVAALLDLVNAPSCDGDTGAFVDLFNALAGDTPTYAGEDPIGDITTTIRQLASCQKNTKRTILSKIGDFFTQKDGGKALRQLLLLTMTIIECLSLWYVMQENNLIQDDLTDMQNLCKAAISAGGLDRVGINTIPDSIRDQVVRAKEWNGDMTTVVATFRVGVQYPAPVLLGLNPEAFEKVRDFIDKSGKLPEQVEIDNSGQAESENESSSSGGNMANLNTLPLTFVPRAELHDFVEGYLKSGPVKQAPPVYSDASNS